MTSIKNIEELQVYSHAIELVTTILKLSSEKIMANQPSLGDQISRAAVSVSSNIAEGFGRGTRKSFTYFLRVSLGSAYEIKSQLGLAFYLKLIDQITYTESEDKITSQIKLTKGLIRSLGLKRNA